MASTIGTARGSTQGSWRPLAERVVAEPLAVTVCCSLRIVAVGLNATRITIASPLLIPPWMPPEWFVAVWREPSVVGRKASLCSLPFIRLPLKPEPISKPFVAGSDITALARSASSLSNTGMPKPMGGFLTTHSITPPQESPSRPIASIRSIICSAMAASGQRTMLASTASRVGLAGSMAASRV